MKNIRLLLVEDEQTLGMIIKETLEAQGFEIIHCTNGADGWNTFRSFMPHICVVDIMMPKKDGLSLVKDIRTVNESVPVIFLTARSQTEDVIIGLKTGADDYMKKPFSMEELTLRIYALLKRAFPPAEKEGALTGDQRAFNIGQYRLDCNMNELSSQHATVKLSQREADLLKMLALSANEIVSRKDVLLKLWGEDNFFNARNMDVYISRLRKLLETDHSLEIINIRGIGFKLAVNAPGKHP